MINIFFQGEGHKDIGHCELDADETIASLKSILRERKLIFDNTLIFLEDGDEPIMDDCTIRNFAKSGAVKIHFHRRRSVEVKVMFNGESVGRRFPVSATIARVKKWAAERKFGMSKEEASEHVLQVSGSHDRPSPGVNLGTLVDCDNPICVDLVPDERVNGATGN